MLSWLSFLFKLYENLITSKVKSKTINTTAEVLYIGLKRVSDKSNLKIYIRAYKIICTTLEVAISTLREIYYHIKRISHKNCYVRSINDHHI